ncbi:MAG: phenylacetic acid degradation bifunctional protein PaaZ [Candidatus Kapabacteria bacterium]|nr:phenylacetic acid degradation bifunctional protein PaaZ [Candidatus Kapabacteria bacterium]
MKLQSYAYGEWINGTGEHQNLLNAVNGDLVAEVSSKGIDFEGMLTYGRKVNKTLRNYTIHERARMLKALAFYLMDRKEIFYELSKATGATKIDSWIDIEGGIGTLFTYASKARREMQDERFYVDGNLEPLSKKGTFVGHHICVPLEGVAIHINAFNFPCWGMLEKMAPSIIAGMPVIIKPASLTSYLTELMVKEIIASNILPEGSIQLVCGSLGNMLDYVTCQDVVTFTGSAYTGKKLKVLPAIIDNSVRFNMEADSLNFCMLGENDAPGTAEFDLFIREVQREMTTKAGQKCTAIRRTIVPEKYAEDVAKALGDKLSKIAMGDPSLEGVKMGPLAGREQVKDVSENMNLILQDSEVAYGSNADFALIGGSKEKGAFFAPMVLLCNDPLNKKAPHDVEAFGPITTILPYKNMEEAIEIVKLGKGSLVGSVFTADNNFGREIVYNTASYHGRIMVVNKDSAGESTGHGSPMPQLVHGGPGRAGGGEELGGIRSILHYMQRTAIQGHPTTLTAITKQYQTGAERFEDVRHPFTKYYEELNIGDTINTHKRTVTETDIVNFTGISWDNFYAHTDITSIEGSIFERRVAHGYFIISASAGLFVNPKPGPVLANYGLDELRFTKPVYAGDTINVKLTVKSKQEKEPRDGEKLQGVVKWLVEVFNQDGDMVALATILTLVERKG